MVCTLHAVSWSLKLRHDPFVSFNCNTVFYVSLLSHENLRGSFFFGTLVIARTIEPLIKIIFYMEAEFSSAKRQRQLSQINC